MASKLNDILDAIVTLETAAALQVGGNALTVVKRKLPKREESVDAAYQVTVAAAPVPEDITPIGSTGTARQYLVKYQVEITLITPNDGHDGVTNLTDLAAWRESVRARYMAPVPIPAVAAVKRVELGRSTFLDRDKLAQGLDYQTIALVIWVYESR